MTRRRPNRSDSEPSTGEKKNCIAANTPPNTPRNPAPDAVSPPRNSTISRGSTGMMIPSASMSMATVMKMNAKAARP